MQDIEFKVGQNLEFKKDVSEEINRKMLYPSVKGGWYIITCSNCSQRFNGGRGQNQYGLRYAKHYAEKQFNEHTCK